MRALSNNRGSRAALLALVVLACGWAFAPMAKAQDALESVAQHAAALESVRSDFVQETAIPMFSHPLRAQGRFLFKRPDALLWEYVEPVQEGFVLRGDKGFRWEDARSTRTPFTPGNDPVATLIARQLLAWITFDVRRIEQEYSIESLGINPTRLKMIPLREDVRAVIASIVITFSAEGPASLVELHEQQGGRTTITFMNTVINDLLDDREFE